jgi:predicted nuclease with TOPRIM domain
MESGGDIQRLQTENAHLRLELERRTSERDKYRKETARIREGKGKLGSNLAALENDLDELQTKHDDALCALGDLRAESARRLVSDNTSTSTVTQAESGKAAAVSDMELGG